MTDLILWKTRELSRLRNDMNHLFNRFCDCFDVPSDFIETAPTFYPDIVDTGESLVVTAEIPGLNPEDLKIQIFEETLVISGATGTTTVEEGENFHRTERRSGAFTRRILLPRRVSAEKTEATYKNKLLKIVLPKRRSEKIREISVQIEPGTREK